MIAEIMILAMAVLFFVISIFLFNGKGKWLIAGYNTATKEEKEKYDEKKLCRAMSFPCVVCGIMLCIMSWLGYRVDSGMAEETVMLPFAFIFVTIIILTVLITVIYINTKAKK
ncbi:MAG: DUF3784 domain-containing protein [Dorea sp.]|nr:DUF3784 domain-containing protein [Dorea sp.]